MHKHTEYKIYVQWLNLIFDLTTWAMILMSNSTLYHFDSEIESTAILKVKGAIWLFYFGALNMPRESVIIYKDFNSSIFLSTVPWLENNVYHLRNNLFSGKVMNGVLKNEKTIK